MQVKRREIKAIIAKVEKLRIKSQKLAEESSILKNEAQKSLDNLAKLSCPYKKGQVFKKRGSRVWAKMTGVSSAQMRHGAIRESYSSAPYHLECLRCNVKGETEKDKFVFIYGDDIGKEWDALD